jgi:hypothetical protein
MPKLWYYNQILLLCDHEAPHSSVSSMQEQEEDSDVHVFFTSFLCHIDVVCIQYSPSKLIVEIFDKLVSCV